jgi:carbonic anhydrase
MEIPTSDAALERLMIGNRRYVAGRPLYPRQTQIQRQAMIAGQQPFAVIFSCSDSRVPSELIFDQGLGDLFIVRTAGHVAGDYVLGSIEYAVHALSVPLIVVMGHAFCGAVAATINGFSLPGHLGTLTATIKPAVERVSEETGDLIVNATKENSRYTVEQLTAKSAVLSQAVEKGQLKIVPAYFELETSAVEILIRE